jgi:hypothetical protein
MPDRLVYIATGREEFLVQAEYAVRSALAWRGDHDLEVLVYTDQPERFARLDARLRPVVVSPGEMRAWRGRWDFFYRVKPIVVGEALRAGGDGKAILIDADTYFVAPVAGAFARFGPGRAVMHLREYHVGTHATGQMRKFRRRMGRSRFRGDAVEVDFWMWNSGAVGLDASDTALIDDWIAFVDEVYPTNPKPIVEQYGLSLLLQGRGMPIAALDDLLVHYFHDKDRHVEAIREILRHVAPLPEAERDARLRETRIRFPTPPPQPPRRPIGRLWDLLREKRRLRETLRRGRAAR